MIQFDSVHVILAIWGFLAGFVCWWSCLRLIEPVSLWLLPAGASAPFAGLVCRLLVAAFLISASMASVSVFALVVGASDSSLAEGLPWRDRFGISFVSSIAGLFFLGVLRRISGS